MRRLLPLLAPLTMIMPAALALAGGITTVSQQGRAFLSRELQIARGDVVRFTNDDDFLHQIYVHSPALNYESAEQEPGQVVDIRFPAAGTFEVRCHIHPKMLARVDVR